MNTKKVFIILSVILFLVVGTLIVYNLFLKNPAGNSAVQTPSPSAPADRISESPLASSAIKALSQDRITSAAISENGQTIKYYSLASGDAWQAAFDGSETKKTSAPNFKNILKIVWSPDKEKAIAVYSENGVVKKRYQNFQNNDQAIFDQRIGYVGWSPDSKKIAYQFTDSASGQSNISVADPDNANWKNIFKTRLQNLIVSWPGQNKISLQSQPSGLAQGFLFALDPATGDFKKVLSDLFGFNAKWSPKADQILYSKTDANGKNPGLYLADETGQNNKNLNLAGLADKCAWSQDNSTLYCALPQQMTPNAIWPDDYYKGLATLTDDFYKIDLAGSTKTKIAGSSNEAGYDAQDVFLSPKEDYYFFTNKKDGLLYSLKLK